MDKNLKLQSSMNWIDKTLSIFGWKRKNISQSSEKEPEKPKGIRTFGDLKKWFNEELPPLALQRVNLRIAKYALRYFDIVINKANDDQIIPESLLEKINEVVKELFKKELPYGN